MTGLIRGNYCNYRIEHLDCAFNVLNPDGVAFGLIFGSSGGGCCELFEALDAVLFELERGGGRKCCNSCSLLEVSFFFPENKPENENAPPFLISFFFLDWMGSSFYVLVYVFYQIYYSYYIL